jgi:hypothetical protein
MEWKLPDDCSEYGDQHPDPTGLWLIDDDNNKVVWDSFTDEEKKADQEKYG